MQRKVDVAAAEKARAEGNNAFKKGKWVDSIGHYTTATVHNPNDHLAYGNRAQAYLKLEKWQDAERDCITALGLQPQNIKALYRRALARKGLGRFDDAAGEPGNSAAKEEKEEIDRLQIAEKSRKRNPIIIEERPRQNPPISSLPTASDSGAPRVAVPTGADIAAPVQAPSDLPDDTVARPGASAEPVETTQASTPSQQAVPRSFADLRKSRTAKAKAYTPSPGVTKVDSKDAADSESHDTTVNKAGTASTTGAEASGATSVSDTPKTLDANSAPAMESGPSTESTSETANAKHTVKPTARTDARGAGIQIVRSLTGDPEHMWTVLDKYEPNTVVPALSNLLEPDLLGKVLLATYAGARRDQHEAVSTILHGLRHTPRISMNVAMLSKPELQAGRDAWSRVGGSGTWP